MEQIFTYKHIRSSMQPFFHMCADKWFSICSIFFFLSNRESWFPLDFIWFKQKPSFFVFSHFREKNLKSFFYHKQTFNSQALKRAPFLPFLFSVKSIYEMAKNAIKISANCGIMICFCASNHLHFTTLSKLLSRGVINSILSYGEQWRKNSFVSMKYYFM